MEKFNAESYDFVNVATSLQIQSHICFLNILFLSNTWKFIINLHIFFFIYILLDSSVLSAILFLFAKWIWKFLVDTNNGLCSIYKFI